MSIRPVLQLLVPTIATFVILVMPGVAHAEVEMDGALSAASGMYGTPASTNVATSIDIATDGRGWPINNIVVEITMPGGLTLGVLPGGCSYAAPVITCNLGGMTDYGHLTRSIPVTPTTNGHHLVTASFTHDGIDFRQPYVYTVDLEAISPTTVKIGMNGPYAQTAYAGTPVTISATDLFYNLGPGTAHDATLTYTLPAGWTYQSHTTSTTLQNGTSQCAITTPSGRTRLTCNFGDLAPGMFGGGNVGLTISATPGSAGNFDHDISVSTSDVDYDPSDNAKVVSWPVLQAGATNMYSSVSFNGSGPYTTGTSVQAYANFGNHGPNTATGTSLVISGNLPGVTFANVTNTSGVALSCSGAGTGTLTCTHPGNTLASGEYGQIMFDVVMGAAGSYTLQSTMNAAQQDSVTTSGSLMTATSQVLIRNAAHADVYGSASIENGNSGGVTSVAPGSTQYILGSVYNMGPAPAANSQLVLTLPSNATYVTQVVQLQQNLAAPVTIANCPRVGQVITCSAGTLNAGDSVSIRVQVTAGAVGNATTQGTASTSTTQTSTLYDSSEAEWRVHNNDAELSTLVNFSPPTIKLGDVVTIKVTVANLQSNGFTSYTLDGAATNVSVRDNLPSGWIVQGTPTMDGGTCVSDATGVTCTRASLPRDNTAKIYITALASGTTGAKLNDVQVTTSSFDLNPLNNNVTSNLTVQAGNTSDLEMDIQGAFPTSPNAGAPYNVSGVITNHGGATATAVQAVFTLPTGDVISSASVTGASCTGTTVVTCTIASMTSGATASFALTVTARATVNTQNLTASVSSAVLDPLTSNNSENVAISVQPLLADLDGTFSIPNGQPTSIQLGGQQAVWEAKVRNNGGSAANNVVMVITVPAGVVSAFANSCGVLTANTITCSLGTIPANTENSRTLQIVPGAIGPITVSMAVSTSSTEGNPADDGATDTNVTVTAPDEADLSLAAGANPAPVTLGQNTTVRFNVSKTGDNAVATHLVATLPLGATYVSYATTQGSCTHTPATNVVDCTLGTVINAATPNVQITFSAATPGVYPVPATISSTTIDPNGANNAAAASATVTGIGADFSILSLTSANTFVIGGGIDYLVTVRNSGPQADDADLTVVLPAGATFSSSSTTSGTCATPVLGTITCDLGPVASGGTVQVHVLVTATTKPSKTLTAHVDSRAIVDDVPGNDDGTRTVTFGGPVVGATGTVAFAGQQVGVASTAHTFTVANSGLGAATFTSATLSGANAADFAATTTCGAMIAPSGSCNVNVTFTPSDTGARTATLTITSSDPDGPVVLFLAGVGDASSDLEVGPLSSPGATFGLGDTIDVTIPVRNNGPQAVAGTLAVTLPAGATFASATTTSGTCDAAPVAGVLRCGTAVLALGGSATVHVLVVANTTATKTFAALVTTVGLSDTTPANDTATRTVTYAGPNITATGAPTFAIQPVGTTSTAQLVTVSNAGGTAAFTSATFSGSHPGDFGATTTCGSTIPANGTCVVNVTFTPTLPGTRAAKLSIATDDPDGAVVISVTGLGQRATEEGEPDTDGDGIANEDDCAPNDRQRPAVSGTDANCDGVVDERVPVIFAGTDERNDSVIGGRVTDIMRGGPGNDHLRGRSGADRIFGGEGNDVLYGGFGTDYVSGGSGNDLVTGNGSRDQLFGGTGNDRINAKDGAPGDTVDCGRGFDQVIADRGDRLLPNCESRVHRFVRA